MTVEKINASGKKFDILYKMLILFSIIWIVVLVTLSRFSINTIQQDIIIIKDKAFTRYTNQVQINDNVQTQLDNK